MKLRDLVSEEERIRALSSTVMDNKCQLKWIWPKEIKFVYIHKSKSGVEIDRENILKDRLKLITKGEYESKGLYEEKVEQIGEFVYRVFPAAKEEGDIYLIYQRDEGNEKEVCTGRIEVRCRIIENKKLFSKKKKVTLEITADVPIDRKVLCYVKSRGYYAVDKEQGTVYFFGRDINVGENKFPEIEVEKDEKINILFSEDKYKRTYELIYD